MSQFCNYELIGELGKGGMGSVYRARRSDGTVVALKVMNPELRGNTSAEERFRRAPTLYPSHPNIVEIYDAGECNNTFYFAMRLVQGESLAEVLHLVHKLAPEQYLPILRDIASALDAAHARGIIHRDIKPSNILVEASSGRAILTDFDIAKDVGSHFTTVGSAGQLIGTARYMSPEQAAGKTITPASDVYALGAMSYELLAGRAPFVGDNDFVVARMHLQDVPVDLHKVNTAIPVNVSAVVMRALSKSPNQRYPSAGAFAKAFADALRKQPSLAPPVKLAIVAGMAALLLIAFATVFMLSNASGGRNGKPSQDASSSGQTSTAALVQLLSSTAQTSVISSTASLNATELAQTSEAQNPTSSTSKSGAIQPTSTIAATLPIDTSTSLPTSSSTPVPSPTSTGTSMPTQTPTATHTATPTLLPATHTPTPAPTAIIKITGIIIRPPILYFPTPTPTPTINLISPIYITRIVINP